MVHLLFTTVTSMFTDKQFAKLDVFAPIIRINKLPNEPQQEEVKNNIEGGCL